MNRPRKILVIPGLGDIHWVALKLQSFIERRCDGVNPEVWVWNFDGRPRSGEFINRLPFVEFGGYYDAPITRAKPIFDKAYMKGEIDVAADVMGFDWFLCFNGALRIGKSMDEILPDCKTNWSYPIEHRMSDEAIVATVPRPYVLAYFSDHGMFGSSWLRNMTPARIRSLLERIDAPVLLTGSAWDAPFAKTIETSNTINLTGQTTFADLLGLIRHARAFVGWCGGNTILSSHFGTPTLMLWSDYFRDRRFQTNWANPATINTTYKPVNVEQFDEDEAIQWTQQWTGNLQTA